MSDKPEASLPLALATHRDKTISALCDHFARDRLSMEQFEQRLDLANRALSLQDLNALLADLPAVPEEIETVAQRAPAPLEHTRNVQPLVAIMGGVERRGAWQPAKHTFVVVMMGGAVLDFRDVQLPPGDTEVTIFCTMGGAEIIVPPGMHVDTSGFAIMGGFAHRHESNAGARAGAPVLHINGVALMGGVDLQVRLPGESAGDARRRTREERKRLRQERRSR